MADLSSMFQNLGPAGGAVLTGIQQANAINEQRSQEAYRQAQMEEIRQRVAQSAETHPLELAAKREANRKAAVEASLAEGTQGFKLQEAQNKADIDRLQTASQKQSFFADMLGKASVELQNVPPMLRFSTLAQKAQQMGFDITNPAFSGIIEKAKQAKPEALPGMLKAFSEQLGQLAAKNSAAYIQAMDVAREHSRSAENVARIGAASREAAAAARNKGAQTIEELVKSGKMTAEKAAVALFGAAQFEQDPLERQRLTSMAQTYEQFAMQQRQAGQAGKPDVGQMANIPTTQLPPAMGGGGPKPGTKENPIKLD